MGSPVSSSHELCTHSSTIRGPELEATGSEDTAKANEATRRGTNHLNFARLSRAVTLQGQAETR